LPREVRARGALDDGAEALVRDLRDRRAQIRTEGRRRRDLAVGAALRRPIGGVELADAEAERVDGEPAHAQARDDLRRQHLELVGPNARRYLHREDAALELDGVRAIGDAGPHGELPLSHRDGRPSLREAILAGAVEEILQRLRRGEVLPAPAFLRARHDDQVDPSASAP